MGPFIPDRNGIWKRRGELEFFGREGKIRRTRRTISSVQGGEPTTKSTHIGGSRALSPLRRPCSLSEINCGIKVPVLNSAILTLFITRIMLVSLHASEC